MSALQKLNPNYFNQILINSNIFLFKDGSIGIGYKVLRVVNDRKLYVTELLDSNMRHIQTYPNAWLTNDLITHNITDRYSCCSIMPFDNDYIIHKFPTSWNNTTTLERLNITPHTYTNELLMKNVLGKLTGSGVTTNFINGLKKYLELPKLQLLDDTIIFQHKYNNKLHTHFTTTLTRI